MATWEKENGISFFVVGYFIMKIFFLNLIFKQEIVGFGIKYHFHRIPQVQKSAISP